MNCRGCCHWLGHHAENDRRDWGRCTYAENVEALMRPTPHQHEFTPDISGGDMAGSLVTHAWFGCVHFDSEI